jgi:hypothetical protein
VGCQKAGTSWWNALLHTHPAVHRTGGQPKELHFFDDRWEQGWSDADAARYARFFPRPDGGVAGEWTPGYMVDFWTPPLLARAAPGARILVLVRDPVERYRSGLTHTDDATRRELTRRDAQGAFGRGLYAQQLRRLLAAIPRERVLVLQYEACREDPAPQLARTFDFLGLAPFEPPSGALAREVNPTTGRKVDLEPGLRAALIEAYGPDLEALRELELELDLGRWPTARALGLA